MRLLFIYYIFLNRKTGKRILQRGSLPLLKRVEKIKEDRVESGPKDNKQRITFNDKK